MPLGDNVQRITDRPPAVRRRAVSTARTTGPAPYDNLLRLATEIEERHAARGRRPHLAPVPPVAPLREAPPPPPPRPPVAAPAPNAAATAALRSRRHDRALLVVAAALVVIIGVLLIWGTDIERRLRPGIGDHSESVETRGSADVGSTPAAPPDDDLAPAPSSTSAAPSPSTASNPNEGGAGAVGERDSAAPAEPIVAACDAASVWPTVTALHDVSPIAVVWVTCTDRYATAGLVPADAPPETPASMVVSLRSDGGVWALLSAGEPAACVSGASAADPAFPTSLCP